MDTRELLQKVKKLEIKTRGLSKQLFAGDYYSAFKGRGMTFSEVKNYSFGDDVRAIDWNVTARFDEPFVKVFEEEREITSLLLLDVSGSTNFGSNKQSKKDLISEVAAILAFSANQNNDKIGAIFFSDVVEKYIPPKKGKKHVLMLLRDWLEYQPTRKSTNIDVALQFLNAIQKKRSIAFLISDFYDENDYQKSLSIVRKKHDLVAIQVKDPAEYELLNFGLLPVVHAESNAVTWLSTHVKSTANKLIELNEKHDHELATLFKKSGVDFVTIETGKEYIQSLQRLFQKRKK